jgi:large subunit ribosomal protein L29
MATVKIKELRELRNEELVTQLRDLKQETMNLRVQQQSGQLENPARLRTVRRQAARISTVLTERRHAAQHA